MTFFTSLLRELRAFRYGTNIQPSRDWFVLLGGVLFLILISIVWNIWTFDRIAAGEILGTPHEMHDTETTDAFSHVKAQFDLRAAQADRYLLEYHFIDPSRE